MMIMYSEIMKEGEGDGKKSEYESKEQEMDVRVPLTFLWIVQLAIIVMPI
jgi:hypothetical protein